MSVDDLQKLSDAELDRMAAREVLGWRATADGDGAERWEYGSHLYQRVNEWSPTTSIADAWRLLEKAIAMLEDPLASGIQMVGIWTTSAPGQFDITLETTKEVVHVKNETVERGLTIAAIAACGEKESPPQQQ